MGDARPLTAVPERSLGLAGSVIKGRYRVNAVASVRRDVVVYGAEDIRHSRPIALKVLRDEFARDSEFVAAVRQQAGTLAMFAHVVRGVARVYEVDATDTGELFVAVEWTEGTTVRDVLHACGALGPSTALRVAIRVGEALEALHHNRILHGQLGPDSVLLAMDSDGVEHVKLVGVELTAAYRTSIGLGLRDVLPAAYIAPEQIERGETTEATDIYALGMLLRELLTGGAGGETPDALAARPPLPPAIERIIATALDAQPERRYPDISVMLNEMWGATTALAEPEPRTRSARSAANPHRRERRSQFTVRTAAVVAVAGIIAVGVWVAAFDRIVSRVRGRVTPSAITVAPVDRDATAPPVQPFSAEPSGVPLVESATPEETASLPESGAVDGASSAEMLAPMVVTPLPGPEVGHQPRIAAPAASRPSGAGESRTPPASRVQAERPPGVQADRPPRTGRTDRDVGDGSAAIDWLLNNRR